jgi:hypothetical protein
MVLRGRANGKGLTTSDLTTTSDRLAGGSAPRGRIPESRAWTACGSRWTPLSSGNRDVGMRRAGIGIGGRSRVISRSRCRNISLAVRERVSASTQNQSGCALVFLRREIVGLDVDGLADVTRRRRGTRLPTVLSVPEVAALLAALRGAP